MPVRSSTRSAPYHAPGARATRKHSVRQVDSMESMDEIESAAFGNLLRQYRRSRDFSVRMVARLAGLDSTYLSRVERGIHRPPKVPTVHRLAQALQLDTDEEIALIEASARLPITMTLVPRGGEHVVSLATASLVPREVIKLPTPVGEGQGQTRVQVSVFKKILPWIVEIYGDRAIPRTNVLVVDVDSNRICITVGPRGEDNAVITSVARVLTGVEATPELLQFLLMENLTVQFGAFGIDPHGDVSLQHTLLGTTCTKQDLRACAQALSDGAVHRIEQIATRRKGQP